MVTFSHVHRLTGPIDLAHSVTYTKDGHKLACVSGAEVFVWDTRQWELQIYDGSDVGEYPLKAVAFSPDGRLLCSAGAGSGPRLRCTESGETVRCLSHDRNGRAAQRVFAVAFSGDGTLVADAAFDGCVRVWDPGSGTQVQLIAGHAGPVQALAFAPVGSLLASGSTDGTVRLWDAITGEAVGAFQCASPGLRCVGFDVGGELLAAGGWDGSVWVWSLAHTKLTARSTVNRGSVGGLAWEPYGSVLVTVGEDATVRAWDPRGGDPPEPIAANIEGRSVAWHDGSLAIGSDREVVLLAGVRVDPSI